MAAKAQNNAYIVGERKNPKLQIPEVTKEDLERIRKNVSKFTASQKR